MERIGRQECKTLRDAVAKALESVAAEHGVTIQTGSGSFDRDGLDFTLKVIFAAQRADGLTREAMDFTRYGEQYGFEPDDLGKVVTINRKQYRVTGLLTKRTKYNVVVEPVDGGKSALFPHDAVLRCMGRADPYAIPVKKVPTWSADELAAAGVKVAR